MLQFAFSLTSVYPKCTNFGRMKKSIIRFIFSLIILSAPICLFSQEEPVQEGVPPLPPPAVETVAEKMPVYPGGEEQLFEDMYNNIEYPKKEKEANIQGKVFVSFVVEKDGSISNIEIMRAVPNGEGLSEAVIHAVKQLKPFSPATTEGEPVRLRMTLPIVFTLTDSKKKKRG